MKLSHFAGLISVIICLIGCSPRTVITAQWKSEEVDETGYGNIFIATLVEDMEARQEIESEFASRLADRNVRTVKSIDTFRPGFLDEGPPSKEQLLEIIENSGAEGILTVTLLDEEEEQRWVPGGGVPMYAPMGRFGFYGNFPGYFNHWHGMGWNTGYYTTDKRYFIETNLYDAENLNLIWSAQSRSYETTDLASLANEYVDAIKTELRENRLIK